MQNKSGTTEAIAWQHTDASGASYRETNSSGAIVSNKSAEVDPLGRDAGTSSPFNNSPPQRLVEYKTYPGYGDPLSPNCVAEGISIPCSMVTEGMVRCPDNDCGPRTVGVYDAATGRHLRDEVSQPFQAFADGYSGFMPVGARYTGGGQWTLSPRRTGSNGPPSLHPHDPNRPRDPDEEGHLGLTHETLLSHSGSQNSKDEICRRLLKFEAGVMELFDKLVQAEAEKADQSWWRDPTPTQDDLWKAFVGAVIGAIIFRDPRGAVIGIGISLVSNAIVIEFQNIHDSSVATEKYVKAWNAFYEETQKMYKKMNVTTAEWKRWVAFRKSGDSCGGAEGAW